MNISKELLSEVLKINVISVEIEDNGIHICAYRDGVHTEFTCNIYELAHKCKEWALKNGYKLQDYANSIVIVNLNMNIEYAVIDDNFNNAYDTERFFKACQWILENK